MSKEIELDCPSGLQVKLRGIKGKDLDGLRDKRRVATGEAFSKLLDDCTLQVMDHGPYPPAGWSWKQALVGDRVRGLIGLRCATSGQEYMFRTRCADRNCAGWIDWQLDLLDLPMKRLSPESRERFLTGNRFETHVGGRRVVFQLTTGESQAKAIRMQEQLLATQKRQREMGQQVTDGNALLGLASRIVEVESESNVMAFLGELDLGDVQALLASMDRADCGVETTLDVVCERCSEVTTTELPLDARFFKPTTTS